VAADRFVFEKWQRACFSEHGIAIANLRRKSRVRLAAETQQAGSLRSPINDIRVIRGSQSSAFSA